MEHQGGMLGGRQGRYLLRIKNVSGSPAHDLCQRAATTMSRLSSAVRSEAIRMVVMPWPFVKATQAAAPPP